MGLFCARCGRHLPSGRSDSVLASRWRRLGGYLLELVIFFVTLGIGWLIWLRFVAPKGQTPAKTLTGMYILDEDGTLASTKKIWVRETLVVATTILGWYLIVPLAADGIWVLFGQNRQTLHDKAAKTVVVWAPEGLHEHLRLGGGTTGLPEELEALARARDNGEITVYEYEERRQRLRGRR